MVHKSPHIACATPAKRRGGRVEDTFAPGDVPSTAHAIDKAGREAALVQ